MKNLYPFLLIGVLASCSSADRPPTQLSAPATLSASDSGLIPAQRRHYKTLVTRVADSLFRSRYFNGCILVARDGEVLYENYTGYLDPRTRKEAITPRTPFHLASVSKTFTAMAVLLLQEEGRVDIDQPLKTYLPEFPLPDVKVRTLLNHRSGLPNYVHYMENLGWDRSKRMNNEDVLSFLVERCDEIPYCAPDTRFIYSNTNYALLALLIERVSGMSYADFLAHRIFRPLGMEDTYVFTGADSTRYLPSFFSNGKMYAFDYLDAVYGDKNIYSTARDLLKWDQGLSSGVLFSPTTLDAAFAGYSYEKPGVHNYGLGWRIIERGEGRRLIYHNGWWHGNRSAFYRLPEERVTIIALSNNDSRRVYAARALAEIFTDQTENFAPEELVESAGGQ